jgi:hypothetical protein
MIAGSICGSLFDKGTAKRRLRLDTRGPAIHTLRADAYQDRLPSP